MPSVEFDLLNSLHVAHVSLATKTPDSKRIRYLKYIAIAKVFIVSRPFHL